MNTINFLEKLAHLTHNDVELNEIIKKFPDEIQKAFLKNDVALLKKELSDLKCYADEKTVVQLF